MTGSGADRPRTAFCLGIYTSYFLLTMLLMLAFSLYIYHNMKLSALENINDVLESSQSLSVQVLNQQLENIFDANTQFYVSSEFQGLKLMSNENPYMNSADIITYYDLKHAWGYLERAYNDYHLRIYVHDNILFARERKLFFPLSDIADQEWKTQKPSIVWCISTAEGEESIACVRYVEKNALPYYIYCSIPAAKVSSMIASPFRGEGGFSVLLSGRDMLFSEGGIPLSSEAIYTMQGSGGHIRLDGIDYIYRISPVHYGGWMLYSFVPTTCATAGLRSQLKYNAAIFLLALVLSGVLALLIGNIFARRIRSLIRHMETIENNNFQDLIHVNGNNEISLIERKYNEMCLRLHQMVRETEITNQQKRSAELKALQAQINPHFLYNILDSINWMAINSNQTEISDTISSLGRFFRLSLSKGKEIITLREEIAITKEYANLQCIRNQDSLSIDFDIAPETLLMPCIKLMIQPFIENAIKHGKRPESNKKLEIIVSSRLLSATIVQLTIRNNGYPILENTHNLGTEAHSGYGLTNVRERLKLYFGPSAVIHLHNIPQAEEPEMKTDDYLVEALIEWDVAQSSHVEATGTQEQ